MAFDIQTIVATAALVIWAASQAYVLYAIRCILGRERDHRPLRTTPSVTILKPLYQAETNLYRNLRSFCEQDYPTYQVVFGVRDSGDPALAVARRLVEEFPARDIAIVVDERIYGSNLKISNLINMYGVAKHELIVIADSDMRVRPDYLGAVVAEFDDPEVGATTCLYRGASEGGLASRLGAMFINEWFLPSVLVALSFRDLEFCFGATMAVRRSALEAIGGLQILSQQLADDHMLGKLIGDLGFKVRLCPYVVDNMVSEPSLGALFHHELRWARTVRTVQPVGYAMSFITYAIPMSIVASIAIKATLNWNMMSLAAVAVALVLRAVVHYSVGRSLQSYRPGDIFFVPLRDIMSFGVWAASYVSRNVQWKDQKFYVQADGSMGMRGSLTS